MLVIYQNSIWIWKVKHIKWVPKETSWYNSNAQSELDIYKKGIEQKIVDDTFYTRKVS
jgi:hypothetical protein